MEYSPVNYYTLGAVYPREQRRQPYPRRRRQAAWFRIRGRPKHPTACTLVRGGLGSALERGGLGSVFERRL